MEKVKIITYEHRNLAWCLNLYHTDWAICNLIKIEGLQSVLGHLLLEEAKVFILDRPHHVVLVDNDWLTESIIVSNNVSLVLLPYLSQRFASSDSIHLVVFSHFLNDLSCSKSMVLRDIFFIIVAEDVFAKLVIFNFIIFSNIVTAALVIIMSLTLLLWLNIELICLFLDTLASTTNELNEEKQNNPTKNEDPVVECKDSNIPRDVIYRNSHECWLLPVQICIIIIDDFHVIVQSSDEQIEHYIVQNPLEDSVQFEALINPALSTFWSEYVKFTDEEVNWLPEPYATAWGCLGKLQSHICKNVQVHQVEVYHYEYHCSEQIILLLRTKGFQIVFKSIAASIYVLTFIYIKIANWVLLSRILSLESVKLANPEAYVNG